MSSFASTVAGELAKAHADHDLILERIQKLEQIQALADELEELERPAEELDKSEATPAAKASPPESPEPPAPRRSSTSAGRRPASPARAASQGKGSQLAQPGGGGAPAGGRRLPSVDELAPRVVEILAKAEQPLSKTEVTGQLGMNRKGEFALRRVQETLESLERQKNAQRVGKVRGGGDSWGAVDAPAPARTPAPPPKRPTNPVDELLECIVATLEEHGPRDVDELKQLLGQPFTEDFNLALSRGITLRRIDKVAQNGRQVYRKASGR